MKNPSTKGTGRNLHSSLRRRPQRTYSESSTASEEEPSDVAELRDRLFQTRDFENVSIARLISVQKHLKGYIRNCMGDRQYVRAREAQKLDADLQDEIQKQALALDQHRARLRAMSAFRKSQESHKFVLGTGQRPVPLIHF